MRLNLSFVILLVIAATAVSFVWRNLTGFAGAGSVHQATVLLGAITAATSAELLARIVVKVSAARRRAQGR